MLNKLSNFQQRMIAGISGSAALITAVLVSDWSFFFFFLLITFLTLFEFFNLLKLAGIRTSKTFGIITGLLVFTAIFLAEKDFLNYSFILLFFPFFFILFIIELFANKEQSFLAIAYTVLGIIYIAVPYGLLIISAFYSGEYNPGIILGILLIIWGNDVGGYFAGKTLGKHKLFLRVSPKKTWEGSVGGAMLGIVMALGLSYFIPELVVYQWVILALIIIVFGSVGDLVESLFKRSLCIKDSGSLIPGHGGFLDRFDGLIMASPFIAAFFKFIG